MIFRLKIERRWSAPPPLFTILVCGLPDRYRLVRDIGDKQKPIAESQIQFADFRVEVGDLIGDGLHFRNLRRGILLVLLQGSDFFRGLVPCGFQLFPLGEELTPPFVNR